MTLTLSIKPMHLPIDIAASGNLTEGYSFTTEQLCSSDQLLVELQNGRFFAGKREEYEDWLNVGDVTQNEANKLEAELQLVEAALNRGALKIWNVVQEVHDYVDGIFYYTNKFDYELTVWIPPWISNYN